MRVDAKFELESCVSLICHSLLRLRCYGLSKDRDVLASYCSRMPVFLRHTFRRNAPNDVCDFLYTETLQQIGTNVGKGTNCTGNIPLTQGQHNVPAFSAASSDVSKCAP